MADLLEATETRLFNRIMHNAVRGFLKGAVIGIAIGATIGALTFGLGIIPSSIIPSALLSVTGESVAIAGAMIGASVCLLPAGRIGQVAGVQSTRDARRYLLGHEVTRQDTQMPPEVDPLHDVSETVAEKVHIQPRPASYREQLLIENSSSPIMLRI